MGVYNSCKFPSNFHSYNDFYISALKQWRKLSTAEKMLSSLSISTCSQETGPHSFSGRHPLFLVVTFFPALELFALETHFTINLFLFSSSPISRNLHSFQVYPSLQKIFFLSLSGSSFTAMGKMNKGHSNMWKSFINCDWDWCPTDGVPYPQWGLPKCADLISLYLTPNKMP